MMKGVKVCRQSWPFECEHGTNVIHSCGGGINMSCNYLESIRKTPTFFTDLGIVYNSHCLVAQKLSEWSSDLVICHQLWHHIYQIFYFPGLIQTGGGLKGHWLIYLLCRTHHCQSLMLRSSWTCLCKFSVFNLATHMSLKSGEERKRLSPIFLIWNAEPIWNVWCPVYILLL